MNADTVMISQVFFRVSEIRMPAEFFLLLVWTGLFHTFDFETFGVIVTSFSRLLRVGSREFARAAF